LFTVTRDENRLLLKLKLDTAFSLPNCEDFLRGRFHVNLTKRRNSTLEPQVNKNFNNNLQFLGAFNG